MASRRIHEKWLNINLEGNTDRTAEKTPQRKWLKLKSPGRQTLARQWSSETGPLALPVQAWSRVPFSIWQRLSRRPPAALPPHSVVPLSLYPSQGFYCCGETPQPKHLEEERVDLTCTFHSSSEELGQISKQELELMRRPWGRAADRLEPHRLLSQLSSRTQGQRPRDGTTLSEPGPPRSIIYQENARQACP